MKVEYMDVHIREDRVQAGINLNSAKSERLFEKWLDAVYNTDSGLESRIATGLP